MSIPLNTEEKTIYCEHWQHNSKHFLKQGCYWWMASQIAPYSPKRILDIGCGTGEGLFALLEIGVENIVVFEENFDCIKATEEKLNAAGRNVVVVPRIGYKEGPDGRHNLIVDPDVPITEGPSITLIHADPFLLGVDAAFTAYVASARKFDAVTVWLIGTYEMRRTCRTLDNLRMQDASDYRLRLHDKMYELADTVLKPGGILHFVDRGVVPDTEELRETAFKGHRLQSSVTSLKPTAFAYRLYEEQTQKGISMIKPAGRNPTIKDDGRRAMHSMISVKP